MKLIEIIKNIFNKKDVKINDNDAIMNVWVSDEFTIAFLEESFHMSHKGRLYCGEYCLWRGLIQWGYLKAINYLDEMPHDIFKQSVNYQFKGNKLLITWNNKSFEFHRKGN